MKPLSAFIVILLVIASVIAVLWSQSGSHASNKGIEEHLDSLNTLRLPAIALSTSTVESHSRIGGLPALPDGVPWPEWKGVPLAFLCQIDLSEIPENANRGGLPPSGMLYFFYNQKQETWGFDPNYRGSWLVIYTATMAADGAERAAPKGLNPNYIYTRKPIACTPVQTYPDQQDERVGALNLTDKQSDQYSTICSEVFRGRPQHHLLGYPAPVQDNEMDLQCQLASNGLVCDTAGYSDPRAKQLEAGKSDWVLLLQLDSDDDTGMMWGDCGKLYFWIKRSDLQAARFENCWMVLQCY